MTYYLLLNDDNENDTMFDSNILGEESFGKFYPEKGFYGLLNINSRKPELLENIVIKKETGDSVTVEEFLDLIGSLKIQKNT
jgi:hypothetical protein|tara:strand:+ start:231 stop:476 length:246 start_codon:yes stop_codon:yes gene_type:complete